MAALVLVCAAVALFAVVRKKRQKKEQRPDALKPGGSPQVRPLRCGRLESLLDQPLGS